MYTWLSMALICVQASLDIVNDMGEMAHLLTELLNMVSQSLYLALP